ncbi:MAG TPA: histidine phosphatase family protein, partial [Chitinophagales bacterium]|nr:histidine phosphatase family protein [Chitinophagales bacterium]
MFGTKLYIYRKRFSLAQRELYVIRHGQTDHNAQGIIQGRGVNLSLNDTGRKQAQAFFEAYKQVPFDMVYTSSLKRTQETAAPFINLGIKHEAYPELDEISWGNLEGTVATHESDLVFKQLVDRWRSGDIHAKTSPTGESPFDLQQRQKRFMENLLATNYSKILIATHGRFIRAFMCTLTGRPLSDMETFTHSNLCLYKVRQNDNGLF